MQIVTVNLPEIFVNAISKLIKSGRFSSRSEAIRYALKNFLKNELKMVEALLDLNDGEQNNKTTKEKPTEKKIDMRSIRYGWPSRA
ncbi:MAG: ribbon-helix-helix domain-containing protein [Promethearchaeota archaeon]